MITSIGVYSMDVISLSGKTVYSIKKIHVIYDCVYLQVLELSAEFDPIIGICRAIRCQIAFEIQVVAVKKLNETGSVIDSFQRVSYGFNVIQKLRTDYHTVIGTPFF